MRKLYTLVPLLLVAACMLTPVSSASAKPLLCKHQKCGGVKGAWELTEEYAELKWGPLLRGALTESCSNEYENVYLHTQFACYGIIYNDFSEILSHWQINVDPYGNITYEHDS